jgi:hypothetical protein
MLFRFAAPDRYRDLSDPARPLEVEIAWTGLPTALLPDATVGGGSARFAPSDGAGYAFEGGRVLLNVTIDGQPVRLRLDAAADGPLRVSPALAGRLRRTFAPDALGRQVAKGFSLTAGGVRFESLAAVRDDRLPGEQAEAGAPFSRDTVVCDSRPRPSRSCCSRPAPPSGSGSGTPGSPTACAGAV